MIDQVVYGVAARPPVPGRHRIAFARLDGTRTELDLAELYASAGRLAAALARRGIKRGDRVGVLAANRLEWVQLDLAALRLGAVTAGFEPGKFDPSAKLCAKYDVRILFTDRDFDGNEAEQAERSGATILPIRAVSELIAEAERDKSAAPEPFHCGPQDVTTIKFTSGSTGEPKGLATTSGSIDSSISAVQEMFEHGPDDNIFIFLPLSLLQQRFWVYSALFYGHDVTISTYEVAFAALGKVSPTVVMGVPGFFETARKHIELRAERIRQKQGVTMQAAQREAARALFGERIRYLWTGSAPARPDTLSFYSGVLEMPIFEGYGLNETCIVSKNHPGAHREGSVGKVLPRKRILFDENGVISVYSDFPVNTGYAYAAPGESERVFRGDVVRTGDVGHLDEDGYLYIHGRADDVIVLDNGRKVIVRPVEERMKAHPAIGECVVYCPTQTHLVAVVSPSAEASQDPSTSGDDLAGIVAEHLERCNAEATPDERIAGVVIADEPFTVDNGLLSSQFKPRRKQIAQQYADRIAAVRGRS